MEKGGLTRLWRKGLVNEIPRGKPRLKKKSWLRIDKKIGQKGSPDTSERGDCKKKKIRSARREETSA